MAKRFAIIGSGWRAEFYVRIALHPGNDFALSGLLCRTSEKQRSLHEKYGIAPTLSEEEIIRSNPDFVVVAVNKASMAEVSSYWRQKGFPVLCETPAAMNLPDLIHLWESGGMPLMVAEQYRYYPTYAKMLEIVHSGKLGTPTSAMVSLAHDYHGASLLRAVLEEPDGTGYRLLARKHQFPVTRTGDRYSIYKDGSVLKRLRTIAQIEFADGKTAVYDFDGEQYHSLIRHNSIRISGTRGELINETLWYLDENNEPRQEQWTDDLQKVRFAQTDGNLSQDEQAILTLMEQIWSAGQTARGVRDEPESLTAAKENLRGALSDAYFMLLLNTSGGHWINAEKQCWMK